MSSTTLFRLSMLGLIGILAFPAQAQVFSSGSTGEDGALNITENTVLDVQEDGVHNYTTISVAANVTLSFHNNTLNTPVILLASGDVTIDGTVSVRGQDGLDPGNALAGLPGSEAISGPGGYRGGIGAVAQFKGGSGIASPGGGPGGGAAATDPSPNSSGRGRTGNGGSHFTQGLKAGDNANPAAPTYGDPTLLTLTGGSGGAGGGLYITSDSVWEGPGGGAGGGAILIASSGSIVVNGTITADGGNGYGAFGGAGGGGEGSGGGAGGAIRLMANSISGSGRLYNRGGGGSAPGGIGRSVIEGFSVSGNLANNSQPSPDVRTPGTISLPPANVPTIRVTSIGGETVPEPATGSTTTPDVIVPNTVSNPVEIQIATTNVPDGAIIKLRIALISGEIVTVDSDPVSGGTATATATLPTTVGVVYAVADFNPGT